MSVSCFRSSATGRRPIGASDLQSLSECGPRGEVGAGVLVISLSYGIGGPIVTIAMLSLALNLMLTGIFIIHRQAL